MQNLALIAPLIILFPSVGAFINFVWGPKLNERMSAIIGSVASGASFLVALAMFSYLNGNFYQPAIVNPPFLDGWLRIPSANLEIPWQQRIDTLSVTMMLFVTFVGTLIHIYAAGYMHGDKRFSRFFAYLNMFLAFMLILITGNNLLMMFVGWEGVGVCSYLLIGFWWDKPKGEGIKNANAARKAFIANRVGDFGVLMALFLTFWTFGSLDFYKPTEVANPAHFAHLVHPSEGDGHGEESSTESSSHGEESTTDSHGESTDSHGESTTTDESHGEAADSHGETTDSHGETTDSHGAATDSHGEAASDGHGETVAAPTAPDYIDNTHLTYNQMGIFGKAEAILHLEEGETLDAGDGTQIGRTVVIGPWTADINTVISLIAIFMLLGAAGKSAQIPLFVWLPDAMAGPTPVSALIHAATMVTAGVYMMVRSNVFFHAAPEVSLIVTIIGGVTALAAGFMALGQWDIKRVLAYSTVSQLGFMVAAVGIGAYAAAIFHMMTHAFFKALLFLGSGSVIHAMEHGHHHLHGHGHGGHDDHGHDSHGHDSHGHDSHDSHGHNAKHAAETHHEEEHFDPQDMRNMGGLARRMRTTHITYLIGTLALAGIWPLAGFWSKDEILADSFVAGLQDGKLSGYIALSLLVAAAFMTAFYMWRQMEMVFYGEPRHEAAKHAPESVWQMTVPLVILAVFSVFVGFLNIPSGGEIAALGLNGVFGMHTLTNWLEYSVLYAHAGSFNWPLAIAATVIGVSAIILARRIYGGNRALTVDGRDPLQANAATAPFWAFSNARMYWDETYHRLFIGPFQRLSQLLADIDWNFWHDYVHDSVITKGFNGAAKLLSEPVDQGVVDGTVRGVGRLVKWFSGLLRRSQTGYVRVYAVALLVGVVAVVVLMLLPVIQG